MHLWSLQSRRHRLGRVYGYEQDAFAYLAPVLMMADRRTAPAKSSGFLRIKLLHWVRGQHVPCQRLLHRAGVTRAYRQ